jgi:hypothetical protein
MAAASAESQDLDTKESLTDFNFETIFSPFCAFIKAGNKRNISIKNWLRI